MRPVYPVVAGALALAVSLVVGGCPSPKASVRPLGGVVFSCDPADAQIFVDDRYQGTVAGLKGRALLLPAGVRRVELRKEGYFAFYGEVHLVKGVRQRLQVKLRKEPY